MNANLKAALDELETEYTALVKPLEALRSEWGALREKVRPLEDKMAKCEAAMDKIRHDPRYKVLSERIASLRKLVKE